MDVTIRINVAEASADGIVDEEQVRELMPAAVVVLQGIGILETVGAYLHHDAIFGTTTRSSIEPNNGALPVRDVLILEVPEE